ncbi:MAG: 3-deoxy-manno-octulosonate cytidylyltransferase [Porphyromonas sp.]|nr:3-deoxy-manno-octulosonate cytidylyltransferase [Porphyromonas sp.]
MKYIAIIPARYGSTRLPGKPLLKLGGKSIIQHVYERVSQVVEETLVATDDGSIVEEVERFGGRAVLTSPDHKSGTDRVWEAYLKSGSQADFVLNVQGDEPFVSKDHLESLMKIIAKDGVDIATLGYRLPSGTSYEVLSDPNTVKVVMNNKGEAIYFSRSPIPFLRGIPTEEWTSRYSFIQHLGVYAFRTEVLGQVVADAQSPLEEAESLEQLRWLEAGHRIFLTTTTVKSIGIDTVKDLEQAEDYLRQSYNAGQ